MTILLDGGTGHELVALASGEPTPIWSAQVMLDAYSATRCRLGPAGMEDHYEILQRQAGEAALAARAAAGRSEVLIAGCLSPYRWSYRGDLALPYDELWPTYAETAQLQAPAIDLILCETLSSISEARAAARGAAEAEVPIWVSWSVMDDTTARLRSGEPLAEACAAVASWDVPVERILVNCSAPEAISAAVEVLARHADRPFGAYANGFTHVGVNYAPGDTPKLDEAQRIDLDPVEYADIVDRWIAAGASAVGGCCDIGPAHIAEINRRR